MAQPKSFTKAGIVFAVGDWLRFDDVLVQASGANELPYICKILSIEGPCTTEEGEPGNNLRVNWYYRPEDIERKPFHGRQELFISDHVDTIHSATVLSKCHVWTMEEYRDLAALTSFDFFSRYSYSTAKKRFSPEFVAVFCSCSQPDNPDQFMAECDSCLQWFHPECEGCSAAQVEMTSQFMCRKCIALKGPMAMSLQTAPSVSNQNGLLIDLPVPQHNGLVSNGSFPSLVDTAKSTQTIGGNGLLVDSNGTNR